MEKEQLPESGIEKTSEDAEKSNETKPSAHKLKQAEGEIGGPAGLEPTRYGDWERKGIISDF
jgi:hypothetical protein